MQIADLSINKTVCSIENLTDAFDVCVSAAEYYPRIMKTGVFGFWKQFQARCIFRLKPFEEEDGSYMMPPASLWHLSFCS